MKSNNTGSLQRILALILALALILTGTLISFAASNQPGPPTRYGDAYTPLGMSGDLLELGDGIALGASSTPTQLAARSWSEPGATDWTDTLTLSAFSPEYWYSDYVEVEQGDSYTYRLSLHPMGNIDTLSYVVLYCYLEEQGDWKGTLDWVDVSDAQAQGIDVRVHYTTDPNIRHWDWPWAWEETMPSEPGDVRGIAIDLQFSKIENMHGDLTPQYFDVAGSWGTLVSNGTFVDINMNAPKEETGFAYTNAEFYSWFKRADEDWSTEHLENSGDVTVYLRERAPDPDPVLIQYEWVGDELPVDVNRPSNDWIERNTAYYPRTQSASKTHTFDGWYHDHNLQRPFARGTVVTEDVTTLYGAWSWDDVKVEYRWVGGDVPTDTTPPAGTTLKKGELYTAKAQSPSGQDYSFDGWYANVELTIPYHSGNVMSDLVLYGAWSKDEATVSYEWIGDDTPDDVLPPEPDSIPVGSWYDAKEQVASGQYYLFSGWYTNPKMTTPFIGASIRENTVLYGSWEKETVKVSYHWVGDDVPTDVHTPSADTVRRGEAYESKEQVDTVQPYTFNGWYRDEALTDRFADNTPILEDTRLFGEWIRGKTTVYYKWVSEDNPTDTTVPDNMIISKGTAYSAEAQAPTEEPFTFAGWYTNSGCTEPFVDGSIISDYTILYGKWSRDQITVTYRWVGNENPSDVSAPAAEIVGKGLAYRAAKQADSAEPYAFDGWYTDQALTVLYDDLTVLTEDTILYGAWAVHTVTVSYEWVGAMRPTDTTPPASDRILRGEVYTARSQHTSGQGMVFEGWYLNKELSIKYTPVSLDRDTTLYGAWSDKDIETPEPEPEPEPVPDPTPTTKPPVSPARPGGGSSGGTDVRDKDRPKKPQNATPQQEETIEIVDETPLNCNSNPGTGR